jgi:drug/metabolite transporter (DMT)-like permease
MWLIFAITASMIWGLDYALGEKIFRSKISPYSLLALQMLFGATVFLGISYFTRLKTDWAIITADRTTLLYVLVAIVTFNLGNLLIFLSIQAKNATLAGLIELCYPIFTVLFTLLLFKVNHVTPSVVIGGLLIFVGVFVVGHFS